MTWFSNLKIRTKLIASFGLVIALVAFLAVFSVLQLTNLDQSYSYLIEYPIDSRTEILNFQSAFRMTRNSVSQMGAYAGVSTSDPTVSSKIEELYATARSSLDDAAAAMSTYENLVGNNPEYTQAEKDERLALSGSLIDSLDEYLSGVVGPMYNASSGDDIQAALDALTVGEPIASHVQATSSDMVAKATQVVDQMNADMTAQANDTVMILIIIAAAIVLISIILAMAISSIISKPIKRLVEVAENVAEGNLNINIDTSHTDETGMLAQSFSHVVGIVNDLVHSLEDVSHKIKEDGDIESRLDADHFHGAYKEVAVSINDLTSILVDTTLLFINCMNAFGDGDFNATMKRLPGKMSVMNETIDKFGSNLKSINKDIMSLVQDAINGKLSTRVDASIYHGDWAELVDEMNKLLEAIVGPINEAAEVMEFVALGNFEHKMVGAYKGEFLAIKEAVNNTVTNIASYIDEIAKTLTSLSNNDLNQEIKREYVGSFANIKDALNNIITTLNKVIGDMNSASEQVAAGAKQISESSMTLAQGATEQASSVEELTATVMSVNEKTQHNAENSNRASELSEDLKSYAQEGNNQMKDMLKSMQAISEASNSISKIIDIIRDISFQTNLLALNASIEAAHAGVHGAGFSVVAEEVRSLAVKSQEAANNTTELIETSIQRVNEGTDIAVKTDQALEKIVSGVTDVSTIISGISEASNEQALAISQINDGVGQIAQVVQDNSATSEESAAAAQELSSQSELMRNMVSVFKMKTSMHR